MSPPKTLEEAIATIPDQPLQGWDLAAGCKPEGTFDRIVFAGMGGSLQGAELLLAGLSAPPPAGGKPFILPTHLVRDYALPAAAAERTLVLAISYSGNTEETLSAFQDARDRGCATVAVASGGELLARAEKDRVPSVRLPAGFQPRCTIGLQLGALARILHSAGLGPELREAFAGVRSHLLQSNAKARAEVIAPHLLGTVPIFYTSERYRPLGFICKAKLNENAKMLAFHNTFPEMNHNELTGYQNSRAQARFHALILRDPEDHPRVLKRYAITTQVLHGCGAGVTVTNLTGPTFWAKCFDAMVLADWLSLALAKANNADPLPVPLVEELKQRLKEQREGPDADCGLRPAIAAPAPRPEQ